MRVLCRVDEIDPENGKDVSFPGPEGTVFEIHLPAGQKV